MAVLAEVATAAASHQELAHLCKEMMEVSVLLTLAVLMARLLGLGAVVVVEVRPRLELLRLMQDLPTPERVMGVRGSPFPSSHLP